LCLLLKESAMPTKGVDFPSEPSVEARELAEAMRAGFEARRPLALETVVYTARGAPLPEIPNAVRSYARLVNHPPVVLPGRLAPVIFFCRRVVRALARPWFEFQTKFNQQSLRVTEAYRCKINETIVRIGHLETRTEQLSRAVARCLARLEENGEIPTGDLAEPGPAFAPPHAPFVPHQPEAEAGERIIEHIFVHTRLPRPPARVLDLGCAESTNAVEMAGLGFEVVGADARAVPFQHPALRVVRTDIGSLPFADGSFDVVVSLSTLARLGLDRCGPPPGRATPARVIAEARRVLRPGGRFILTLPFGRPALTRARQVYDGGMLDALLEPFQRIETAFGVRDGEAWSYTTDVSLAEQADSGARVSAVALVVAENS
jgi:SAM-dependent methyltransferase